MSAPKIPVGYVRLDDAAKLLTSADARGLDAARAYLMLVVNTQHDPTSPPLRYWAGSSYQDVYVNPNDVRRLGKDFEWWSAPLVAPPARKRGRPKGSELPDGPLVVEGLTMVQSGRATSINDAANKLASRAHGASYEAKVRRLGRKMQKATKATALEQK